MSRHRIDTSITLTPEQFLSKEPAQRAIEIAELSVVPEGEPPREQVSREPYLPDPALVEAVNLAVGLGRPLLLQGDPGCGKTRLAYALAYVLGLPLEECYIKSTSRAQDLLYTYDAVTRLYEAMPGAGRTAPGLPRGMAVMYGSERQGLGESDSVSHDAGSPSTRDPANPNDYVRLGPLGRAIVRAGLGRRSVVLIDEIDKADLDFPNDLLRELDRLEFQVSEVPGRRHSAGKDPALRPIVIVTHNEEKALPNAFLRRCVFHYLEFPEDEDQLRQILALHQLDVPLLAPRAIQVLQDLRSRDLVKKPGLSELIDWIAFLISRRVPAERLEQLPYSGLLLKQHSDEQQVRQKRGDR